LAGCGEDLFEQAAKKPKQSIIGKTTQDVGEFDPAAGKKVSDSKIRASDPVTAPLAAYGPMVEQISKTHIAHALNLFNATNGRYPKDYDEFMREMRTTTSSSWLMRRREKGLRRKFASRHLRRVPRPRSMGGGALKQGAHAPRSPTAAESEILGLWFAFCARSTGAPFGQCPTWHA
jgi:hypothetical protein